MDFHKDINKNLAFLSDYFKTSTDCKLRRVYSGDTECAVVFMESTVNQTMLQDSIFTLLLEVAVKSGDMDLARRSATAGAPITVIDSLDRCSSALASGITVIFVDGIAGALGVDIRTYPTRPPQEPNIDKTLIGARDGFTESVMNNLALIRKRLCTPNLHVCTYFVGGNKVKCFLVYMPQNGILSPFEERSGQEKSKKSEQAVLSAKIRAKLDKIEHPCLTYGDILPAIGGNRLIPTYKLTERPDTACSLIAKGKVIMLMEGQPMALCLPTTFFELMDSPNDASLPTPLRLLAKALRYLGALLCLALPGLYVSLLTYNRTLLPPELTALIIQSESRIALSLPLQVMLTWLLVSLIFQVGISLPTTLGGTIGIFGSIVLGQALVNSNLASEITLLVVVTAVVGSYCVPNYSLSTAIRPLSLVLLLFSSAFGLVGCGLGMLAILAHILNLTSCQSLFFPLKKKRPYLAAEDDNV